MELLRELKGQKITGIVRLFSGDPANTLTYFPKLSEDHLFAVSGGPVFLFGESGLCIGFSSSPKDQSVITWKENIPLTMENASKKCFMFKSGFFIDCKDGRFSNSYWPSLLGSRIERLAILKIENEPGEYPYRNERGLLFVNDREQEWLVGCSLKSGYGGGFQLIPKADIRPELFGKMTLSDI